MNPNPSEPPAGRIVSKAKVFWARVFVLGLLAAISLFLIGGAHNKLLPRMFSESVFVGIQAGFLALAVAGLVVAGVGAVRYHAAGDGAASKNGTA
jgi:hypothetical protein